MQSPSLCPLPDSQTAFPQASVGNTSPTVVSPAGLERPAPGAFLTPESRRLAHRTMRDRINIAWLSCHARTSRAVAAHDWDAATGHLQRLVRCGGLDARLTSHIHDGPRRAQKTQEIAS